MWLFFCVILQNAKMCAWTVQSLFQKPDSLWVKLDERQKPKMPNKLNLPLVRVGFDSSKKASGIKKKNNEQVTQSTRRQKQTWTEGREGREIPRAAAEPPLDGQCSLCGPWKVWLSADFPEPGKFPQWRSAAPLSARTERNLGSVMSDTVLEREVGWW